MTDSDAPKRGHSPPNNRLLTILLDVVLALVVLIVLAVIVVTVGVRSTHSTLPYHSS